MQVNIQASKLLGFQILFDEACCLVADGVACKAPGEDNRPTYFVEIAKTGDTWLKCKDGGLSEFKCFKCWMPLAALISRPLAPIKYWSPMRW